MPKITPQAPPKATAPGRAGKGVQKAGVGLFAGAVETTELEQDAVNIVIYGENRVGKTTLACEFDKPLLLLGFDPGKNSGAASVSKVDGVVLIRMSDHEKAIEMAKALRNPDCQVTSRYKARDFRSHCLDTTTSLQDVILQKLMNLEELPVQLDWGTVDQAYYRTRSEIAKSVMQFWRDIGLYRETPVNTIFTALMRDHSKKDDDEKRNRLVAPSFKPEAYFAADLGPNTVKWMHNACDYIGHLHLARETKIVKETAAFGKTTSVVEKEVETGRIVHRLRTLPHPNFAAGIRSATPGNVPEFIQADNPREMYLNLMRVVRGEKIA